jgi:hypothetical protein
MKILKNEIQHKTFMKKKFTVENTSRQFDAIPAKTKKLSENFLKAEPSELASNIAFLTCRVAKRTSVLHRRRSIETQLRKKGIFTLSQPSLPPLALCFAIVDTVLQRGPQISR